MINVDKLKWEYKGCVWMADASSQKGEYVIRRSVNVTVDGDTVSDTVTYEVGHQTTRRGRTDERRVSEWPTLKEAKGSAQAHNDSSLSHSGPREGKRSAKRRRTNAQDQTR